MKLCNLDHNFNYETEKVMRVFFPFEKIQILSTASDENETVITKLCGNKAEAFVNIGGKKISESVEISQPCDRHSEELAVSTALFKCLEKVTGYSPKWGLLTGVRPARLYGKMCAENGEEETVRRFKKEFFVSEEKISLCKETHKSEEKIILRNTYDAFSLYISVPFCPTRCSYCSFVSHSVEKAGNLIEQYVSVLCDEIRLTREYAEKCGLKLKTVYIGGGTPTVLSPEQLKKVIDTVYEFDTSELCEFTVEAGRPDTVNEEKLLTLKNCGVTRISINPQTMNDTVLKSIGRNHTVMQTEQAFELARKTGFDNINMDIIAGLPSDTEESFEKTVNSVLKLSPESVTVHSLAMKRASTLNLKGDRSEITDGKIADKMVNYARSTLSENGILPYYMYRQSKTVGNLENVGYARKGFECLYNVYIMDETHTILACGASAVTKLREPYGENIERIFNYKYPYEYLNGFETLKERKKNILNFYEKYGK